MAENLHIIPAREFQTTRWKNGGGITHEIVKEQVGDQLLWRISIAEMDRDATFSPFGGFSRILTVIEGAGLDLHHPDGELHAVALKPLQFSGDLQVEGRLISGNVRNFNLIFDGIRVEADVSVHQGADTWAADADTKSRHVIYCISGAALIGGVPVAPGAAALFSADAGPVEIPQDGCVVLVVLRADVQDIAGRQSASGARTGAADRARPFSAVPELASAEMADCPDVNLAARCGIAAGRGPVQN
jgi:uncharacterized protein